MFCLLTSSREDVIDTKPWWFQDVGKLILGSMTDGDDKDDPTARAPIESNRIELLNYSNSTVESNFCI